MKPITAISLVRHGRVHNPEKVFYGRLPRFGLSETGLREARAAGEILEKQALAAVFSSPLLRARQTAEHILAAHPLLKLRQSKLLLEIFSPWDGKPAAEVDLRKDDIYSGSGPQFEQPRDVALRVERFFSRVLRDCAGTHVAAVTHGDVIAFAVLWANRAEVSARSKAALHWYGISDGYPATGSITTFSYDSESLDRPSRIRYTRPAVKL